jgi:hypothetical protein
MGFGSDDSDAGAQDRVTICVRPDLQFEPLTRGSHTIYVVKDPVRATYFEMEEHEFALLQRLNGTVDWNELREWFNRRFPPLRVSISKVWW